MSAMAKRWILLPMLAICVLPALAFADPIHITSGGLVGDQNLVDVTLESKERGFSLVGEGTQPGGIWDPGRCNGLTDCLPGSAQSLTGRWFGNDFDGTATVDGTTYEFGSFTLTTQAAVDFEGSSIAPPFTGNRTKATVVRPFTFEGEFTFPFVPGGGEPPLDLVGNGKATLRLSRPTGGPAGARERDLSLQSLSCAGTRIAPVGRRGTRPYCAPNA